MLQRLRLRIAATAALVALSAGCESSTVVRTTTLELAAEVDVLHQRVQEYQTVLEESSARRLDGLAVQRVALAQLEYASEERTEVWRLAGADDTVKLLDGIEDIARRGVDADREFRSQRKAELRALRSTQTRLKSPRSLLASLSQQLRALAEERDLRAQLEFLVEFGQKVHDGLEELRDELEEIDESGTANATPAGG